MAVVEIHAPVEGYTGTVAGVTFDAGVGLCDGRDVQAVAYFRRHGYGIQRPARPVTGESALVHEVPVGTIPEIVAWVEGDPGRARAAVLAEQRRTSPRSTLIDQLTDIQEN